jgi:hypothetical protein
MKITKVVIDQEFIDYRNEHADRFGDFGRTEEEKIMDSDGLLPEYILLKSGKVEPPYDRVHDWIFRHDRFDNKMVNQDSNTVSLKASNIDWMRKAVAAGHLTKFSITKWVTPHTRALQVGDVVEFEWYKEIPAREALSAEKLRDSKYYENCVYFFID